VLHGEETVMNRLVMHRLVLAGTAAVVAGCLGIPALVAGAQYGLGSAGRCPAVGIAGDATVAGADAAGKGANGWDADQLGIAATIVETGVAKGVPRWGWLIAVATAMQESGLRNLPHLGDRNDHDSIGVFQQRPSQGWGTPAKLADPAYQAGRFYDRLRTIPGWETMPLTDAAQVVQRSAYPDAYARWADDATQLVDQLADTGSCVDQLAALPSGNAIPPAGPAPIAAALRWALTQLGTQYQFGGTCTDSRSADPTKRCDCSSLVQQAYAAAGISLPRITLDQVHAGTRVASTAQLHPGDLIFTPGSLGTAARPRHVGLYLGDGRIIHAPGTGRTVTITTVQAWEDRIAAIRRIAGSPPLASD
jgi:cell wall-associated NlpC family hydrolase